MRPASLKPTPLFGPRRTGFVVTDTHGRQTVQPFGEPTDVVFGDGSIGPASGALPVHAPTHAAGGTDPVTVTGLAGFPGGTSTFLRADGAFATPPTPPASPHASTHAAAGSDPVAVTGLAGFPGGTTTFLRADGTFAAPPAAPIRYADLQFTIDGGGAVLATGIAGDLGPISVAATILAVTLLADQTGSIVVDIWKDSYASYPPTLADSIVASAPPTISSGLKAQDTTLTGWTTAIAAGDTLRYSVTSVSAIKRIVISLKVQL